MVKKIVLAVLVAAVGLPSPRAEADCSGQCDIYHCNDTCWDSEANRLTTCRVWDHIFDSQCDSLPPTCRWQPSNRQLDWRDFQGDYYELPWIGWFCAYNIWYMNWEKWSCPNWEERCSFQELQFEWLGPVVSPEQCGDW